MLGAVSAAGTVAAAMVALWIAVSDSQRRDRAEVAQQERDKIAQAHRAAVVVVRTTSYGGEGDEVGHIMVEVQNLGEHAVLDVTVQAVWCLEPPTWDEPYALAFGEFPQPRVRERLLEPMQTVSTDMSDGSTGPLNAVFAGDRPATQPNWRDAFGKVVTVARWQERSGERWERVEENLPRRLDQDGATPLPASAVVLWDRDNPLEGRPILESVRPRK
ncbi:hypothetical protein [Mobilicoccus massiliensis]|uniref:hypothetical protein n=1 Tax=Mobilicoccus massiliensis TaxID=1522310 RepID=UPI001144C8E5|nr:hypothetical protein [Mobilicoccus massiliensis]